MSWTEVGMRGPKDQCSSPSVNVLDGGEREGEEEEEEEENEQEKHVITDEDYDTDLELGGIQKVDFGLNKSR